MSMEPSDRILFVVHYFLLPFICIVPYQNRWNESQLRLKLNLAQYGEHLEPIEIKQKLRAFITPRCGTVSPFSLP